ARENPGRESPAAEADLPEVASVRLAVDVAACDNRPLVVLFAPDSESRQALEKRLTPLAWDAEFRGRFIWASTTSAAYARMIAGAVAKPPLAASRERLRSRKRKSKASSSLQFGSGTVDLAHV